ncbi:MotA/TolQ/ExbB proton channel family protein [Sphingomonas turrisvirgatae]|uniref:Biopolymer transport protein ExbB n=1 Tax=Sphingomonas turrisvirgatae TaxID=1888892 RepID=A0A1E3LWE7_9SPHN|nr:MotA/TolQ/ExbB proton channel family protein [Sphingomonas turrisvirgatae]ODP38102.1 flagellar motor protein MotA [Sphingomonas turrisvirgatae]
MLTTILAGAAAATPPPPQNFDILHAMNEGGVIAWGTAIILTVMLFFSLYILFTKVFEQQKILNQYKRVRSTFWNNPSLREGAAKLEKNSAYRQIVDDALLAQDQYKQLTDPIEAHDWLHGSLRRSEDAINSQLGNGLSFLATVGATAPFIGLFGTVVGIFRALIKIGAAGDASIGTVAGPVGEALIMTALGLVVAVPAVLAYNWLQRRNKAIAEQMSGFSNDVLGYLASDGRVRPTASGAKVPPAAKPPVTSTTATTTAKA